MKKTTLFLCSFIATVGMMKAQQVQLPAAYYDTSASVLVQDAVVATENVNAERNLDVNIPFTGTYGSSTNAMRADVIYDNGPFWNVEGSPNVSLLEVNTLGMTTLGAGAAFASGYSVADDVELTESYSIEFIDVFAYQTGSTAPTVDAVYLQIWDGDPSAGANVVWGDLTTNILEDSFYADANRASENTPDDTSRQINRVTAFTNGLTLAPGTYWIHYSFGGSGSSGPWAPPIAILGEATTGNAMQYVAADDIWQPLEDGGSFTPQGMPFIIYGTPTVGIKDNALSGFNFYPNPTSDVVNLKANSNIEAVSLFNLLGQKVMTINVDATASNINLEGLAAGTYVMQVSVDGQTGTYKITKK